MGRFLSQLICRTCGKEFIGGHRAYYCKDCHPGRFSVKGVGSGGNQRGERNNQWKGGNSGFQKLKLENDPNRLCERCGKDLSDIVGKQRGGWAVHHKDHNRKHSVLENLELLCKRCHQLEHECWKAFLIGANHDISKV